MGADVQMVRGAPVEVANRLRAGMREGQIKEMRYLENYLRANP